MTTNPFEQSTQQLLRFLTSHAEWEVIDYIRQEIQHDAQDSVPTEDELLTFFLSPDVPTALDTCEQMLATDKLPEYAEVSLRTLCDLIRYQQLKEFMKLLDVLPIHYAVSVTHWDSFRIGTFREQFTIAHQDGTSFWLGAALNGKTTEWGRVRLDFNPNKVAQHSVFQTLLLFLVRNTRPMHRIVKRFDLAVDIPADRFDCFLVKDNRAYSERRHGREWTQYLGAKSSTVGRVKLYNKTVESHLDYPLTRLELTLDPAVGYDEMAFPTVYAAFTAQISTDEFEATDTERFILGALLGGYGTLNMLGRKTRAKMEQLLTHYVRRVEISKSEYTAVLSQLYLYTQGRINAATDGDQPPPKPTELPAWVQDIISETRNLDL